MKRYTRSYKTYYMQIMQLCSSSKGKGFKHIIDIQEKKLSYKQLMEIKKVFEM